MNPREEGDNAKSSMDNPYWKNYPKEASDEEVFKTRQWVDGYVQRVIDERNGCV